MPEQFDTGAGADGIPAPTADTQTVATPSLAGTRYYPAARWWRIAGSMVVLSIAAVLLFARLGHYALWDDEAATALDGEGVWQTGDTSAIHGRNIMAIYNGLMLTGLKNRYVPPLQDYVAAPFAGLWPGSALAVRIPFALLGFLTVALVCWWTYRDNASFTTWVLITLGIIANVSFWLYCRQCRYYALIIFLSAAIAYLYLHFENRWWVPPAIGLASAALFASNYMAYAALYGALGIDWFIWGRKQFRPGRMGWLGLWAPQVLLNVPVFWIWYPFGRSLVDPTEGKAITNRLELFWWFWRDMDVNEFGVMLLVCVAPLLWFWRRDYWLLRAPLAVLVFIGIVAMTSPQKMHLLTPAGKWVDITRQADIRYLCPIILPMIFIAVLVITSIFSPRRWWLSIPLGAVLFFSDGLHLGGLADPTANPRWSARSTPLLFAEELLSPPGDPYTAAAEWINENVEAGKSIYVVPSYMAYPLMFHAPNAVYAWQFKPDKRAEYPTLPAIDFEGDAAPDYIIVFGRAAPPLTELQLPFQGLYVLTANLDVYGRDIFRPELTSRTFVPILGFKPIVDGIRIYERI